MSLPKREAHETPGNGRHGDGANDLPDWLINLQPDPEPSRPAPTPSAKMVSHPKAATEQARPAAERREAPAISLVNEDDLPQWLKELGTEPPERSLAPLVTEVPPASTPDLPAWVDAAAEAARPPVEPVAAPVEAPPVWAARRIKEKPEEEVVASLAEPEPDMAPLVAEPVAATSQSAPRAPFKLNMAAVLFLLLVVAVLLAAAVFTPIL